MSVESDPAPSPQAGVADASSAAASSSESAPSQTSGHDATRLPKGQDVARRKVFYVSGFDPLGPRRYRELCRREGAAQAAISGYDLQIGGLPKAGCGNYRWRLALTDGAFRSEAEFEFLGWDDIVRKSIRPSLTYVYALMFRTLWIYLSSGAIAAMLRLRAGPLITGLVPAFVMIFYLLYAGLIGGAAGLLAAGPLGIPIWAAIALGLAVAFLAMCATRAFEEQAMVYFMVNDLAYSAQHGGRYPAPLSRRLDAFAARIDAELTSGKWDEVLIVGHSSGAQLAVSSLARCLAQYGLRGSTPPALLTLGQSIAMTSFLPEAHELRSDLARIADDSRIFWLDVTAPGDGACFALTDPVANCREKGRPEGTLNPVVISAAFRHTMMASELRQYRWRLLRIHFQYLCAFARPRDFDYFLITAGPQSLASRFAGRACSPSMRAEPVAPVLCPG